MRGSSPAEAWRANSCRGWPVAATDAPPLSTRPPASESRSLSSDLALRCWITREICAIFFSTLTRGTIALADAIEPSTKGVKSGDFSRSSRSNSGSSTEGELAADA